MRFFWHSLYLICNRYGEHRQGCKVLFSHEICSKVSSILNIIFFIMWHRHWAQVACLTPICALHGKAVTTIEGVGNINKLHPIQVWKRLHNFHPNRWWSCIMPVGIVFEVSSSLTPQGTLHLFDFSFKVDMIFGIPPIRGALMTHQGFLCHNFLNHFRRG